MGKRKPVSLLKRKSASNDANGQGPRKRRKSDNKSNNVPTTPKHPERTLVPVNQTHRQAANIVGRLLHADATGRHGASLKSLTLAPHIISKKAVHAVTIETLKHVPVLEQLVSKMKNMPAGLSTSAAYVLIRELLWSSETLQPSGPAERAILALEKPLRDALTTLLRDAGVRDVNEMLPAVKLAAAAADRPRTARVNELKMSVNDALEWLQSPPKHHVNKWGHIGKAVTVDPHLSELLIFPPSTDLHDHPLVTNGALILQSKASCMTARALDPEPGWKCVDACAAPGNKTTHLAALISAKGHTRAKVIAFDKDSTRLERLRDNSDLAGASSIIDARVGDFLAIDPSEKEFADVDAVLLDPSCSGSGTAYSRMDHLLPSAASKAVGADAIAYRDQRVEALSQFQTSALRHALNFPGAKRVVYSTCSLHAAENEQVVAAVLDDAIENGFQLIEALPQWERRGEQGWGLEPEDAAKLVRTGRIR